MKDLREQLASRIQKSSLGSTAGLSMLMIFIIFFINFEGCGIKKIDKEVKPEEIVDLEALRKKFRFPIDIDTARKQKLFFEPTEKTEITTDIVINPDIEEEVIDTLSIDSLIELQVAKTTHTKSTARSAGTRIAIDSLGSPVDFADSIPFVPNFKTKMALDVFSPRKRVPVTLRLESSTNDTAFVEVTVRTGKANEWDSLTFDFTRPDAGFFNPDSIAYDRIFVYFDKDKKKRDEAFYWDNIELVETAKEISFESSSSQSPPTEETTPDPPQAKEESTKDVEPEKSTPKVEEETSENKKEESPPKPPSDIYTPSDLPEDPGDTPPSNKGPGIGQPGNTQKGPYGFGDGIGGNIVTKGFCKPVKSFDGEQRVNLRVCIDHLGNVISIKYVLGDKENNTNSTTEEANFVDAAKCSVGKTKFGTLGMEPGDEACGIFLFNIKSGGSLEEEVSTKLKILVD